MISYMFGNYGYKCPRCGTTEFVPQYNAENKQTECICPYCGHKTSYFNVIEKDLFKDIDIGSIKFKGLSESKKSEVKPFIYHVQPLNAHEMLNECIKFDEHDSVYKMVQSILVSRQKNVEDKLLGELYDIYRHSKISDLYVIDETEFKKFLRIALPVYMRGEIK